MFDIFEEASMGPFSLPQEEMKSDRQRQCTVGRNKDLCKSQSMTGNLGSFELWYDMIRLMLYGIIQEVSGLRKILSVW